MKSPQDNDIVSLKIDALKELTDLRFKAAADAVLTAQGVQALALAAALTASEKEHSKIDQLHNELNRLVCEVQKDIILLREGHSHIQGNGSGKEKLYGWIVAGLMAAATLYMGLHGR
jgi:hypothetical protein